MPNMRAAGLRPCLRIAAASVASSTLRSLKLCLGLRDATRYGSVPVMRVLIGIDGDWNHVDARNLSWIDARDLLAEHLRGLLSDDCAYCAAMATEELERLERAAPGRFEAEVDGQDYLILED